MTNRVGPTMAYVIALLLAPATPVHADDCAGQTQGDLNECAGKAFATADKALNATYKEVMDRLRADEATRKLLVAAQKSWLGFRDGECDFEESPSAGGSIHPMAVAACRTKLTKARTQALRAMLKCGDNDVGCPVPPK